jgi:hypothetical protein
VPDTALDQIGDILKGIGAPTIFAARRTATADDMRLEIKGLGRLDFPISPTMAKRLCGIARPASYGKGEQTLLDRRVRDTWEIPKSRVRIDQRRWNRTLLPMLETMRADLGLPEDHRLKAELHSMLVYAPGQFFLPHQDSEKADDMIGTLVVTLPSPFKGGAIVVEHQGEIVSYLATTQPLTFVAFYADCRHEVRPVKGGYRIVLTYNLRLDGDRATAAPIVAEISSAAVAALSDRLHAHFTTPLPPRWAREKDRTPRKPPNRLVYLLDHQYTERGLSWQRLKGRDVARAKALQAAAEREGCETVLALADVHEIWACEEEGWNEPRYRRRRNWESYEDDDELDEDESWGGSAAADLAGYTLVDLQDSTITLSGWLSPTGKKIEPVGTLVEGDEVCTTTPSSALEPYESEYEGYMGNYGNTMDRWYRRAAIVLWPHERAFSVHSEASPAWGVKMLKERIRAGAVPEAQAMAVTLLPFWENAARQEDGALFFDGVLDVAEGIEEPFLAASLLRPLSLEMLAPERADTVVALMKRYGEDWMQSLLVEWASSQRHWQRFDQSQRLAWLASLPDLCEALRGADEDFGTAAVRLLLNDRWKWSRKVIEEALESSPPSRRDEALAKLARPILGFLRSTAVVNADDLRNEAVTYLCAEASEPLIPCLLLILRAAVKSTTTQRAASGLDTIARHCARWIEERLKLPVRAPEDWSIALPEGCSCVICGRLGAFLAAPSERKLEWPIAKDGRMHIHRRIDDHELPVQHETRRKGSPFTLVLIKTQALFNSEAEERRTRQADLAWLGRASYVGGPERPAAVRKSAKA